MNFFIPLLITVSQTIYGWNAMYAASRPEEMQNYAFISLEKKAAEKCADYEYINDPQYSYASGGAHYADHAFVFIRCKGKP